MVRFLEYGGRSIWSDRLNEAVVLSGETGTCTAEEPYSIIKEVLDDRLYGSHSIFEKYSNIGIIVNDRNRPTPTHLFFRYLIEELGSPFERISKVHVATGSHKEPSEPEIEEILGDAYEHLREKVHIHVAKDGSAHRSYGETSRGNRLMFDKALDGHDLYLFVNSVEPHYFAGFTGGRKSIIPGMAYYDTIEYNHRFALDAGSRTLGIEGNPVHEDMKEAAGIFLEGRNHFSIQMVQGPGKILSSVHTGDINGSFFEAKEKALCEFCIPIDQLYDVVITVARSPMDKTLYQAQKAIENGKLALKDGGVIVLVAACEDGIGQSTFWDLLTSSDDPRKVMSMIDEGYKLGYHKAAKIVQLHERSRILLLSEMDQEDIDKGFIDGYNDLDKVLDSIPEIERKEILIIPDGTVTVPHFIKKRDESE